MSTNSILINYVGYPVSPREFFFDNGLANLAGSLIANSHRTIIWDYSNADIIKTMFPHEYKHGLLDISNKIFTNLKNNKKPSEIDLKKFHELDAEISELNRKKISQISDEIGMLIENLKINWIGFKLWIGEGFSGSIAIAEKIRKAFPDLYIFAGGPQVDWFGKKIYEATDVFDALVYGEGEETIVRLADFVEKKIDIKNIPNLIYKNRNEIITTNSKRILNLNDLALPVYDNGIYYPSDGNKKIKVISIDESRGCPNSCHFCFHPKKSGNKWRIMEPTKIANSIELLMKKYNVNSFKFAGSNSPPYLKMKIAKEIIKRKLKIKYSSFCYTKGLNEENFSLLRESGCSSLFFGIESADERLLHQIMNKKIKINEIKNSIINSKKANIKTVVSVIVPAPFQTDESVKKTYELLIETKPDSVLVNMASCLPNTEWFNNMEKYGFNIKDKENFYKKVMTYTVKTFYPTYLWKDLPEYELNGKSFKKLLEETNDFILKLKKENILTHFTDDLFLLTESGKVSVEEINNSKNYLLTGDYENMINLIGKINTGLKNE